MAVRFSVVAAAAAAAPAEVTIETWSSVEAALEERCQEAWHLQDTAWDVAVVVVVAAIAAAVVVVAAVAAVVVG